MSSAGASERRWPSGVGRVVLHRRVWLTVATRGQLAVFAALTFERIPAGTGMSTESGVVGSSPMTRVRPSRSVLGVDLGEADVHAGLEIRLDEEAHLARRTGGANRHLSAGHLHPERHTP